MAAPDVAGFGVPFEHVPVTKDTKPQAEARMLELLSGKFDLIVLARYMQILSGSFLEQLDAPVINIHHSFLPAFVGAEPYRQARERGVKIIGATAHYVTEELDAGPIIEQDVVRVSHRDDIATLARVGGDVERTVLWRAVEAHLQDRTIVHARHDRRLLGGAGPRSDPPVDVDLVDVDRADGTRVRRPAGPSRAARRRRSADPPRSRTARSPASGRSSGRSAR